MGCLCDCGNEEVKPIKQDKFWRPDRNEDGNCFQAAVASIFGLDLSDVPNFMDDKTSFQDRYVRFVWDRGFSIISVDHEAARDLDAYYLALGPSARGCGHVVVYRKGVLAHDPFPEGEGLLSVSFVHLFVPRDVAALNPA